MQDPYHLDDYLKYNAFLPDINNELDNKSERYRDNFRSLERLVLVRFVDDVTVVPRESSWFGFFDGDQLQIMQDTQLYQVLTCLSCLHLYVWLQCFVRSALMFAQVNEAACGHRGANA